MSLVAVMIVMLHNFFILQAITKRRMIHQRKLQSHICYVRDVL